jgi:hypothetical protein
LSSWYTFSNCHGAFWGAPKIDSYTEKGQVKKEKFCEELWKRGDKIGTGLYLCKLGAEHSTKVMHAYYTMLLWVHIVEL